MRAAPQDAERAIERVVLRTFAPLRARAFGVALGVALAAALAFTTLVALVRDPQDRHGLGLLGVYLHGYTVSPAGLAIGALWALALGFVLGACIAGVRNVVLRAWLRYVHARAQLVATRDILDHI